MVTNMKCRPLLTACLMVMTLWLSPLSAQASDQGSDQMPVAVPQQVSRETTDTAQSDTEKTAVSSEPKTESAEPAESPVKTDSGKKYSSFGSSSNKAPAPGSGLVSADPVTVISGLMLVVALIFAVAWLMKRIGAVPVMPGQAMKILAALSVGTREKVILIEVGEKQVLLGVAPGRVSHLQTFDEVIVAAPVQSSDFASTIKKFLQPHASTDKKAMRQEDEK